MAGQRAKSVRDFEEVIRLDREYIENWSVLSDIQILCRTLPAALGRGAYLIEFR